ncbi:hypothetical protein, partial [Salmonella sp. gx-f5]|uniref:hypothetical protein n=1 Tax=Salmonella sp. gx-f5 TaxID=2582605 RepID=UPI001F28C50B
GTSTSCALAEHDLAHFSLFLVDWESNLEGKIILHKFLSQGKCSIRLFSPISIFLGFGAHPFGNVLDFV